MYFIGRKEEIGALRRWDKKQSMLTVIYGRRRIGKTRLIQEAFADASYYKFEGIEGQTSRNAIGSFQRQLARQFDSQELLELPVARSWDALFLILSRKIGKKPAVVVIDEFQWFAGKGSNLTGYLKYAWDSYFSVNNRMHLIVCGSVSSFMVKKVLRSRALYGRVHHELSLQPLKLQEIVNGLGTTRSIREIVEMYMVTGGIPQYIQLFNWKKSVWLNIQDLCFTADGFLVGEVERIFTSHFGDGRHYKTIIIELARHKNATREQLQTWCGIEGGGRISEYLEDLELSGFIEKFTSLERVGAVRYARYRLADFYLLFYYSFIAPRLKKIADKSQKTSYSTYMPDRLRLPWTGLAFERICINHAGLIAGLLGFSGVEYRAGSWYSGKKGNNAAQIDLLFIRADHVITLCEIKYHREKCGPSVIAEVEQKILAFPNPKKYSIEKVLITLSGASEQLVSEGYFNAILTIEDIFGRSA